MMKLRVLFLFWLLSGLAFGQEAPPEVAAEDAEQKVETEQLKETAQRQASTIEFVGLTTMPEREMRSRLAEQFRLIEEEGLTRPLADDTAFYVELFLRRLGYSQVEVRWEILNNGTLLRLTVNEGPRTMIGKIEYTGDVQLDQKILTDYLIGATRERFSTFASRLPFVQADIDDGVNRVRSYYLSEGYLESVIERPSVTFSADLTSADIQIEIKAGPQYRIGVISFQGEILFPETELMAAITEQAARPYTKVNIDAIRRDLQFFYTSKGYYFAKVTTIDDPSRAIQHKIPITFVVEPGQYFTFDSMTVAGLQRLHPDFMFRRFRELEGKPYNPKSLDKIYRRMMETGLFERLTINKTPVAGNQIRLDVSATEAESKAFGVYGGVATYEGFIVGVTFENRNVFGNGRPFNASAEITQRGYSGEVKYRDPWLFETDYEFTQRVFAENTTYDGYTLFKLAERAEIKHKYFEHLELTAYGQVQRGYIPEAQLARKFLGPREYYLMTGGIAALWDQRDNIINPANGWYASSSFSYNKDLEDLLFHRFTVGASYYKSFGPIVIAVGGRFGTLITDAFVGNVPVAERFFNGGATSVRSYGEYELGPLDNGTWPIGGLSMSVFNAELDFPIIESLRGALFADAGSVSFDTFDVKPDQLKYGVGLGLRYNLPIGPIRADYGFNPDRSPGDPFGAFHFSFGFAF